MRVYCQDHEQGEVNACAWEHLLPSPHSHQVHTCNAGDQRPKKNSQLLSQPPLNWKNNLKLHQNSLCVCVRERERERNHRQIKVQEKQFMSVCVRERERASRNSNHPQIKVQEKQFMRFATLQPASIITSPLQTLSTDEINLLRTIKTKSIKNKRTNNKERKQYRERFS